METPRGGLPPAVWVIAGLVAGLLGGVAAGLLRGPRAQPTGASASGAR